MRRLLLFVLGGLPAVLLAGCVATGDAGQEGPGTPVGMERLTDTLIGEVES